MDGASLCLVGWLMYYYYFTYPVNLLYYHIAFSHTLSTAQEPAEPHLNLR